MKNVQKKCTKQFFKIPKMSLSKHKEKSYPQERYFEVEDKMGLLVTMDDHPGVLAETLNIFLRNNVNLTYINSKPSKYSSQNGKKVEFFMDFDGKVTDKKIQNALAELKSNNHEYKLFQTEEVPWFPKRKLDLNMMGRNLMSANDALASDHPGFKDDVYRKRRAELVNVSNSYNLEDDVNMPRVKYTDEENSLWGFMWDKLTPLQKKYACKEHIESLENFQKNIGLSRNEIPQLADISRYLKEATGTIYRPVGGLLTQREFLNGLAFRVFHSTQYIRHRSAPLYTPEPDIIHEVLGHAILFANNDFADFSQEIGLASLAASDEDITKLGSIYWFTIEFGLCLQENQRKIYGAGVLSSPSEIEWSMSDKPEMLPFDLIKMAVFPYSITEIQHKYWLAPSFAEMKKLVIQYAENIKKPFNVTYNTSTGEVEVDRRISTRREVMTS